jgi:serine/threonine protein kinase/CRP-like cAMP-binding protein
MIPARPTSFGRYDLLELLAIGGMAEVYLARTRLGGIARVCVIKRVLPEYSANRQFVSMFIDEARITIGLEHENVVRLLDFGQVDGAYYMAIEYVDGIDLVDVLRAVRERGEGVPPVVAAWVARSFARGLAAAHGARDHRGRSLGIVHRDVSPHNVFIGWDGHVKIGDFGVAAARNKLSRTTPGTVMGKYGYMSPEQAGGDPVDARTDVWAAGVVLWEMLVGRRLFATDSPVDTVARVVGLTVPAPSMARPGVPAALDDVCLRALTRPLPARTPSAAVFADELDAFLAGHDGATSLASALRALGLDPEQRRATARVRGRGVPSALAPQTPASRSTRSLPGPHDAEVQRLEAAMRKEPSLALIAQIGERYAVLGLRTEALSASRTAAYHYAHRGLLVQAVCTIHALRALLDDTAFDVELERLARLRGDERGALDAAMASIEHRVFVEAVAEADAGDVTTDAIESTFVAPTAPLLSMLAVPDFVRLARVARVEHKSAGASIVLEGERGDAVYAVGRGRVVVHTRRVTDAAGGSAVATESSYIAALGEGDFFGEFSFLTDSPRAATVEAASDVVVLRLDRDVIEGLVDAHAVFREHLVAFYKERVVALALAKNPILGALSAEVRHGLVTRSDVRKFHDGEVIVRQGDVADEAFVLLSGEVEVTRESGGIPVFINKLFEGQLFGEMAAAGDARRTATVYAMGDVEVLAVSRAYLEDGLAGAPDVRRLLEASIQLRAAETDARVRETVRIFGGV